jgi:hypothetical protein
MYLLHDDSVVEEKKIVSASLDFITPTECTEQRQNSGDILIDSITNNVYQYRRKTNPHGIKVYANSDLKFGSAIYHDNFRVPARECSYSHCLRKCYSSCIGRCFEMVLVFRNVVYLIV